MSQTILRAYNDDGDVYDLDVFNEQQFLLDISAIESGDIGKVFGITSQTFALPPTDNNNDYFGNLYDLGVSLSKSNFIKTFPCQVLVDGIEIFTGKIYLEDVITDQNGDTLYNCNVVNETIDFKQQLIDTKFGDLDFSSYDHNLTYANIEASWANALFSGDIVYPLADYGIVENDTTCTKIESGIGAGKFTNADYPVLPIDFKPAIRVKALLGKIFDYVGYDYTSSFFDSAYADSLYMLATRNDYRGITYDSPIEQNFRASQNASITPLVPFTAQTINFDTEQYDNSGGFTSPSFTPAADGQYNFNYLARTQFLGITTPSDPRWIQVRLVVNGFTNVVPASTFSFQGMQNNGIGYVTSNFTNVNLLSTDVVTIQVEFNPVNGGESADIQAGENQHYFEMYQGVQTSQGGNGGFVDIKGIFDNDESVVGFMNGLIQKFNLIIEPLKDNPEILSIEPFNTWVDNGVELDWTDKVDRSIKYKITHPMAGAAEKIYASDVIDKDTANQYSINVLDKTFGSKNYLSESDLSSGTKKIGTYFAPTPMKYIPGTGDFIVPIIHAAEDKRLAFKPRLLHYLGLVDSDSLVGTKAGATTTGRWYFGDGSGTTNTQIQHPVFHHLSELPANVPTSGNISSTVDLHFSNGEHWEYHQSYVNAQTPRDAWFEYWSFYINELYDVDSRLLTLNIVLKPQDIPDIALNDKIFIDGHFYRINKIQGANLTNEQSTVVELIKTSPRKRRYPRRRIGSGIPGDYVDIEATGPFGGGVIVYEDEDGGVASPPDAEEAGRRDYFSVYSGSIGGYALQSPVSSTNTNNGINYVDDRVSNTIIRGSGNVIEVPIDNGEIRGDENNIYNATGQVNIFGNNVTLGTQLTGSVTNAFIVSNIADTTTIVSASNIVALNPVREITEYDNNKVIQGNTKHQGSYTETYINVPVGPGTTTYLTGSSIDQAFHHHFQWTGANGNAIVYIDSALLPEYDGVQQRFTTDNSLTASKTVTLTPIGGLIDGAAEEALSTPYDGLTAQIINGGWLIIQKKG